MKFLRKIARGALIVTSIVTIFLVYKLAYIYKTVPFKEKPLPFHIDSKAYAVDEIAQNSDVLIIGDKLGINFNDQVESLVSSLSTNLKKPISIYNFSTENENIYRTLEKVKKLKRLPNVIIYMGGSAEFSENLYPKNLNSTWINFKRYNNEYISSLVMLFPILSKYFFVKDYNQNLKKEISPFINNGDSWFQKVSEMSYFYYQESLRELIDYIQERRSSIILITNPINLEIAPIKECDNSSSDELAIELNDISILISEDKYKEAYKTLSDLNARTIGNAKLKFLLGKAELKRGNYSIAKTHLQMAKGLDCNAPEESIIINSIIKKMAIEKNVDAIDFENIINDNIGRNTLFISSNSPQFIYWEKLQEQLQLKLKGILEL